MSRVEFPRIALVHDWLTGMRGGEKVLDRFCRLWPDADLYALFRSGADLSPAIERMPLSTSFLQHLPAFQRYYRYLLPLMPAAARGFRLANYDLVLSTSHCVAKGVRPPLGTPHVCYCFTPMRYAWQMRDAYFGSWRSLPGWMVAGLLVWLRWWDRRSSATVTHFVAISETIRRRIRECYARDSVVIYPPVDTDFYTPAKVRREDYYLVVSAFAPYKRIDLAIEACNRLKRDLLVIGTGQEEKRLRSLAGPTIHFAGWQPDEIIRERYRRSRALLFPGEEDFGIVPVEANACGTPVICLGRGGASETILPLGGRLPATGVWFDQPTVEDLVAAIRRFEAEGDAIAPADCRRRAARFNPVRFDQEITEYVGGVLGQMPPRVRDAGPFKTSGQRAA